MAEDVHPSNPNPCCALWIKRSQKLEKSRDALRQSVKILEAQIQRQSNEIASLKNGITEAENQQIQTGQKKEEIIKEAKIKKDLEKQILDLKIKISSFENTKSLKNIDDDIGMLKSRISAGQEEIKSLKELLDKERRKTESECRKTELEKKKAAEAWKLLKEEKRKAEGLTGLLEAEKKKSEDSRLCLEKLKVEANELREKLPKVHDAKKQIEAEILKANAEKKRADSERTKAKKLKKLIEEERKNVIDVKKQANHLCLKLEEERRMREQIQKKFEELSGACNFGDREKIVCKTLKAAELKLLKDQLRLERKKAKHAKRVAKQEKYEKRVVAQEVHLLKQNLMQILYRLDMLDGLVSHNVGSPDDVQKCSKKNEFDSPTKFRPPVQFGGPFTYSEPISECVGLPVSRGFCGKPKTGINFELESPVGGSLRKKSQSSAACSTSIHFPDRKLLGSQARDSFAEISTTTLADKADHSLPIGKCSSEAAGIGMLQSRQIGATDTDGSSGLNGAVKLRSNSSTCKAVSHVCDNSSKKRKIEIHTKPCFAEDKLHYGNEDDILTVNDQVRNVEQFSLTNGFQIPAVISDINCEKYSKKESLNDLCKNNYDHVKNMVSTSHQTENLSFKHDDRKKAGKTMYKYSRDPCCDQEAGPESSEFVFDQSVTSLGSKLALLKSFENMISGGCLKLLELDNNSDEIRYINALKTPISPTLPEIEIPNFQIDREDISYPLMARNGPAWPLCSSDIEIGSDNSKLKILTNKDLSNDGTTRHNIVHDVTQDTFLADNSESLVVEHGYHDKILRTELERFPILMETISDQQDHFVKHFPVEHNKIQLEVVPVSMAINGALSWSCKKSQPPHDEISGFSERSHAQLFHEGCQPMNIRSARNHNHHSAIDNLDSSSHLSSCEIHLNEEIRGCQPMKSDFVQNQKEAKTLDDPVFAQGTNLIFPPDADKFTKGNIFISAEKCTGHTIQQPLESVSMSSVPNLTISSCSSKIKSLSKIVDETDPGRIIRSFTSLSSARNIDSMSRIICAFISVTPQNLMVLNTDLIIVEILDGLQLEDLQSEEKVAVFFSLLLGNLSERMSDHCKQIVNEDFFQFLESFSIEIVRAVSSGKTKDVLDQVLHLDNLFCLMESFLMEREVLVIGDVKQHPSSFPAIADYKFHLDVGNNCVFSEDATINQFIAGCTILASICIAVDDMGILLVFSYKLLQTCRSDITWVLLALHVFANIFGKRFFSVDNYSFLVTTINSVVLYLEDRLRLVSYPPPYSVNSTSRKFVDFSPCKQCPFAADAICMDKLVRSLLDILEDCSLTRKGCPNRSNHFVSLYGSAFTRAAEDKDSSDAKINFDVQCDAACAIFRYSELSRNQPDCCSETAFCDFTDIISLVELMGQYMGWEWMYQDAVPRLMKMLEVCVCEEFSASIFVLVGELGRQGISSGGYQQAGIPELRSNLTVLLDTLIARKASFPTQVAAVGAVLKLIPLKFEDILNEHRDVVPDLCGFSHIKPIKKWFFIQSKEQQLAAKNIFDNEIHLR